MWNGKIEQVHWEPTDKCNSACPMCSRYDHLGYESKTLENAEWTLEDFKKTWTENFILDLKKILACGNFGDPCVCKDFVDIYEYCREINPEIELACNTNASLRNPDWWYRLGKLISKKGNYCTFSLDGLEDTNHLYRRNTVWTKIMENARAFIDAGGIAHWDFIVFEHNEHQVDEAKDLAKSMGFQNFNIKRTTRWKGYRNNQGYHPVVWKGKYLYELKQPTNEKFKHNFEDSIYFQQKNYQNITLEDFKNMAGNPRHQKRFVDGKYQDIDHTEIQIACRAVANTRPFHTRNEIFISAGGHVAPCCFLGSEPFRSSEIADKNYLDLIKLQGGLDKLNIHKNNIYDILNLDIFRTLIPNTWNKNGNMSMRPRKCTECCGLEFNALDFGELGDKKDSDIK
jgi:MoaA/NifB/PqqE/SkfB family radical SAM enzyme